MARSFASGDYVEVANNAAFDVSQMSVSFWLKTTQTQGGGNEIGILSRGAAPGGEGGFHCELLDTGLRMTLFTTGGAVRWQTAGTATANDGKWHQCGWSMDQANGSTSRIIFDGAQIASAASSGAWTWSASPIRFAKALYTGWWQNYVGSLAEVAIWSGLLTDAEWLLLGNKLAAHEVRPDALVDYWRLIGTDSPETSTLSARTGALTGSSLAIHPSIIVPNRRFSYENFPRDRPAFA